MTALRDRPFAQLSRHFFGGLFDLGFLSEAGTMPFTRLIIGICASFLAFGLLLLRVYAAKYAHFAELDTPEPYRQAILADHAFLIAVPMWIVAFAITLVGHAVFPDETDFRVLSPLPITRKLIFGAKALAVAAFAGVFIVSAQTALAPLVLVTTVSRWAEGAWVWRVGAYGAATLLGSAFAVLGITALQGLLVLAASRGRLSSASATIRSVMLCALVLALPLLGRLPARGPAFAAGAAWVFVAPPAWFAGLERWIAGDGRPHIAALALLGLAACAAAGAVAAGSYALLYRRFDRLMIRPAETHGGSVRLVFEPARPRRDRSRPMFAAIRAFTLITLRRSVLHQGVLVVLSAIGAGLVANSFIASDLGGWLLEGGPARYELMASAIWAPFALIYVTARAVRMSLLVPIEPRANWLFRMTERGTTRADQLGAATHALRWLGVIVPVALLLPIQGLLLGARTLPVLFVTLLFGWLYVELLMTEWGRIPFTCSFIPGKGFVPQRMLKGAAHFVAFTTTGTILAQLTMSAPLPTLMFCVLPAAATEWLRRRRLQAWTDTPLEFEDLLPSDVNPLRLN